MTSRQTSAAVSGVGAAGRRVVPAVGTWARRGGVTRGSLRAETSRASSSNSIGRSAIRMRGRRWSVVGDRSVIRAQDAYLVGLLHDIGPLGPLEEEHLGIDHGAVAGLLISRWALPAYVAEAMCWQLDLGLPVEGRPREVRGIIEST